MLRRLHLQYPLFLSYFNKTGIFWTDFRINFKYYISWKSAQWETKFFRADRGRDRHGGAYRSFWQICQKRLKMGFGILDSIKTETEDPVSVLGNDTD